MTWAGGLQYIAARQVFAAPLLVFLQDRRFVTRTQAILQSQKLSEITASQALPEKVSG